MNTVSMILIACRELRPNSMVTRMVIFDLRKRDIVACVSDEKESM